ncbi:hypothetical protein FB004_11939 [Sinorhizobium medicae]|uniref:hypothetical protein n=1 Tax=Sinorhizobium medicae TaxID=110321 RepID=UPI0011A83BB5|nr:hypothetical protein [Sinorhizobium medicae]TWA15958.1 hypothetical protein FB004_11939 [Sinorhizobium medicae]
MSEYPSGPVTLAQWGPTWVSVCKADLGADGYADILLIDRLHRWDHADHIAAITFDRGRYQWVESEDGKRTLLELIVFRPDPEHDEREWLYKVRNPQHVFNYPRFTDQNAA